jgi:hypothetical protein
MRNEESRSITRSLSIPMDLSETVDNRVNELNPWIKNFSSYVQALIHIDLQQDTLGQVGGVFQGKKAAAAPAAKAKKGGKK